MPLASVVANWLNGWGERSDETTTPGEYILGGPHTPRRVKKKQKPKTIPAIVFTPPEVVFSGDIFAAHLARKKLEDDLVLADLI